MHVNQIIILFLFSSNGSWIGNEKKINPWMAARENLDFWLPECVQLDAIMDEKIQARLYLV